MMNELVTHDEEGRFIRESFQAGNNPSPLDLPVSGASPKYKLYLGNPCPVSYCYPVVGIILYIHLNSYTCCGISVVPQSESSNGNTRIREGYSCDNVD